MTDLLTRLPREGAARTRGCVRLARAGPADGAAVAVLFEALHDHNAALDPRFALADDWRSLLDDHFARTCETTAALWLLAWEDAQPVGLLIVEAHQDSPLFRHRGWAELVALYVAASYRGTGLAGTLTDAAARWAAARGFDRLQLYVTATNDAARRFYRRHAFSPVQEIWRLEVTPHYSEGARPPDPSHGADGCGADVLESGHHHLAMEADCPPLHEERTRDLAPQPPAACAGRPHRGKE